MNYTWHHPTAKVNLLLRETDGRHQCDRLREDHYIYLQQKFPNLDLGEFSQIDPPWRDDWRESHKEHTQRESEFLQRLAGLEEQGNNNLMCCSLTWPQIRLNTVVSLTAHSGTWGALQGALGIDFKDLHVLLPGESAVIITRIDCSRP